MHDWYLHAFYLRAPQSRIESNYESCLLKLEQHEEQRTELAEVAADFAHGKAEIVVQHRPPFLPSRPSAFRRHESSG